MRTIGIVGGGQLGRMLSIAAQNLGFETIVLDPTPNSPAGQVTEQIVGDFKDGEKIKELAKLVDFMTFEIESANVDALEELLTAGHDINPSPSTLSIIKDKYLQKKFLSENHIPVAQYREVAVGDLRDVIEEFGYPILLKTKRDAYDGRGNALIEKESDILPALEKLGGRQLYVERFFPFVKELAVIVARDKRGNILPYPPVETIHKNNICHLVISPAPVSIEVQMKAQRLAVNVMNHLNGVGVFGIEMFLSSDGEVVVNEIAPRVHNSGHHSIEAHETSQFEQHIRAITGMPLGSIKRRVPHSVMINILGERSGPAEVAGLERLAEITGAHAHIYGKAETRPERKMGHITVIGDTMEDVLERAKLARSLISI